ncbi:MAG TPA: glycoside hydrolase family 3 N-terminal domain-containing protein [Vicinamibacterales bacterium]|nr:glycoside hydrolase family 3 N-terminal domain-containing protein [Vicinamibacterales bacterium]
MPRTALRLAGIGSLALLTVAGRGAQTPPYKDPARPVDERVADLLGRMTLEEKVAQLVAVWIQRAQIQDEAGRFVPDRAQALLGHGIGEVARPSEIANTPNGPRSRGPREQVAFVNAVQQWLIEHTRLGIPAMFHEEALHGFVAPLATHFPVPIALGSTWDPALVERVMAAAAREARARGAQHVLAPVVDLGRDPRWGRIEETFGEDPYLVARFAVAAVRGFQGPTTRPLADDRVFATLKHFAGHGSHEGGINTAPVLAGERLLRAELLAPFEAGVKAGVWAVMPSYNEIDGVPLHANRRLIHDVLRGEWVFAGAVVSDYFAIAQLAERHGVAADKTEAARMAIEAGVDLELPDPDAFRALVDLVRSGRLPEATVDRAAGRILAAKVAAGLFERPFADPDRAEAIVASPEHRALALEAARKAIVLLKNDGGVLPLDRQRLGTLAVIGPNAKGLRYGGYSSSQPPPGVDVLTGITRAAGPGVKVVYAEGVRITEHEPNWWRDEVIMGDPEKNRARIREAVALARQADAIVAVVGTNESVSREAWSDTHLGDASDLSLPAQQSELIDALAALRKPLVVVLINGRPLAIPEVAARVPAILEAWYPGQEGGIAVGEALFGDINPGGKLPVSIPRSAGQLPVYYNRRPTSFRNYLDGPREPLWPFGHGLSYTTFELGKPSVSPATIRPDGRTVVTVSVTNTGRRAGDEVVQLYIRDVVSSVTRPTKELAGFERVTLRPGETRAVTFTVGPEALSLVGLDLRRRVEPGRFEIMVGTSSAKLVSVSLEVVDR